MNHDNNIGMVKKRMRSKKRKALVLRPPPAPVIRGVVANQQWLDAAIRAAGMRSKRELNSKLFASIGVLHRRTTGELRWNFDEVMKLAEIVKRPFDETAREIGFDIPLQKTDVIGVIRSDGRVTTITGRAGELVASLPGSTPMTRALIFESPSGPLAGYHGMALHYRPTKSIDAEAYGRLAVIEVEGEPMAVIGQLERGQRGALRVTLLTGEKIEGKPVLSAAAIEGIVKP